MKLLKRIWGKWEAVGFKGIPSTQQVEDVVRQHANSEGLINTLCLDFVGEYLPVNHVNEARLVSCLVVSYMQSTMQKTSATTSDMVSQAHV